MFFQSVVDRELRVQARRQGIFSPRFIAAAAACAMFEFVILLDRNMAFAGPSGNGPWLFALLHTFISIFLAVACPLLIGDTLSRERREGTLGLLLLTPLPPSSIVAGKLAAHLLRAFSIWLSVVPVLILPVLIGGVGAIDVAVAVAIELTIVLGASAAGLWASSITERWGAALGLALFSAFVLGQGIGSLGYLTALPFSSDPFQANVGEFLGMIVSFPWAFALGLNGFHGMPQSGIWPQNGLLTGVAMGLAAAAFLLGAAVRAASLRVQKLSRTRTRTPLQDARAQFWLKPREPWRARRLRQASSGKPVALALYAPPG